MEERLEGLKAAKNARIPMASLSSEERKGLKRLIHSTVDRVTRDIEEERQLNTAVARLMELSNGLAAFTPRVAEDWSLLREGVPCF